MGKHQYSLSVKFVTDRQNQLYTGPSWYNTRVIDSVDISSNQLTIFFARTKKMTFEEAVLSPASPVRYQFYRAVCFYLSVEGVIPEVDAIDFILNGHKRIIDKSVLTMHWANCKIGMTLPSEKAVRCFTQTGKPIYIAMTYFIKAQLDSFSHDCFRAAWSGLNALYNELTKQTRESDKLVALALNMKKHTYVNALIIATSLSEEHFWKRLQWYQYCTWKKPDTVKKDLIDSNLYRDIILYHYLSKHFLSINTEKGANEYKELEVIIEKRKKKKVTDNNDRLMFLVCDYCYMLRNRSFHADKPYPVFGLFSESSESVEHQLTKLLLATIKDIIIIGI